MHSRFRLNPCACSRWAAIYAGCDEAQRPNVRDEVFRQRSSDMRIRLRSGGRIIICATRFHEADLIGRLQEVGGESWYVIRPPAICEDEDSDPLGRELGEALWPDSYPLGGLEDRKRVIDGA